MGQNRMLRALLAGSATIAVAATLAGPAGADPSGTSAVKAEASHSKPSGLQKAAVTEARAGDVSALAADVPGPSGPAGLVAGRTINSADFEDGLPPDPIYSYGWTGVSGDSASGTWHMNSQFAAGPGDDHLLYLEDMWAVPGERTFLSFVTRGSDTGTFLFGANDTMYSLDALPAVWSRVMVDITAATSLYDGYLAVAFQQFQDVDGAASWDVDAATVFTCLPPPNAGVRGDWTGEGKVDLLEIRLVEGTMWLHPGRGTGFIDPPVQVGAGWSTMTWIGSPGDVTGDRRTDLLARRSDGLMFLYAGRGGGGFGKATQVGQAWNGMTAFTTPTDLDGDGRLDLLARRSDGTLHLYKFLASGALTYTRQIGAGWGAMTSIVGVGDVNGDRRGDVYAVRSDGVMFAYNGGPTGLTLGRQIGSGWNAMARLASPGDLNRDARGDIVGLRTDGALFFYPGTVSGLGAAASMGTGFSTASYIL